MPSTKSLRVMCQIDWPNDEVSRLWDGSGPVMDTDGNVWIGAAVVTGLDAIEQAINGEAYTLELALTGAPPEIGDLAWQSHQHDEVIGAKVQILVQPCDQYDQPIGAPRVHFTGTIDNIRFEDSASGDRVSSNIVIACRNRFTLRRLTHGAVLSDTGLPLLSGPG